MATTTNFGWETPDDTDLVKDGALAIRTLGSAIDTSLVDLKGGTTGQVLSKTSNTDMDFTWVTSDDANAIQNAIVDAKGDLIAASAADTPARLAVGNNGETLVADSSATTGLRWTATPSASNPILNSAMQIWQRGTSFALASSTITYTADRWACIRGATGATISRQTTSDTTNLPFIQYATRVQRDSGNTSTALIQLTQSLESSNSTFYAGKTITFSFYARAGANFSAASSSLVAVILTGTGTDQNLINGFTGVAQPLGGGVTLTTTWQRFTFTGTISSSATQVGVQFYFTPTGTAGANDWAEITGVQIDVGSVALPFRTYAATLAGELCAGQRYYWRTSSASAYSSLGIGFGTGTTTAVAHINFPITMRTAPTSIDFSALALIDTAVAAVTNATIAWGSGQAAKLDLTSTGLTTNRPYMLQLNNNAAGYVGFSAEL